MSFNYKYFILMFFLSSSIFATVNKDLAYPKGDVSADEIANQVYYVNHFYAMKNYAIIKKGRVITALILRSKGEKPLTITLERYLNNDYSDGVINSQDLAIFRSGKLKGTGMLITDFVAEGKSQSYEIWIPSIRKIRRFAQPAHDDAWGGSDFTFGDVTLRKPKDETHELLGKTTMKDCLQIMDLPDNQRNKYTKKADIKADCSIKGKEVYQLKSSHKTNNWWYDYRVSYIDTTTFADYRTEYFKGGNKIKIIDRSWINAGLNDKRANYWAYWYGKNLNTGHESLAYIPQKITKVDKKYKKNWWSTKTLRKIKK